MVHISAKPQFDQRPRGLAGLQPQVNSYRLSQFFRSSALADTSN